MASMRFRPIQPTPKKPMRGRRTSGLMRCPSACNSDKLFTRNSRTFYELVEVACLSVLRLFLMQEGQLVLVEDLEEVVPGNLLEFFLRFLEVDAQQTAFAGRFHAGWAPLALLHPFTDFIVISGGFGFAHGNV